MTALGYTAVEIGKRLHVSSRTVETHRSHLHEKLHPRTRSELVRYALGRGLLDPEASKRSVKPDRDAGAESGALGH